jgi:SDR family mycofactocin-dependent oxidoreductase
VSVQDLTRSMNRSFAGKVVVVSGAARGQGRSHAVRFAEQGADVIAFDICAQLDSVAYPMSSRDDLDQTVELVENAGGRIVADVADVRHPEGVDAVLARGAERFGTVDVVVANAGISVRPGPFWEQDPQAFRDVTETNLFGVWNTFRAAVPMMIRSGTRGSLVAVASGAALKGTPNIAGYVASKAGVVGLARSMAREVASYGIRVNCVLPGNTDTPMFRNESVRNLFVPERQEPTEDEFLARAASGIPMGVPFVDPADITEAVTWLASDAARYVTGTTLVVDGGGAIP